MKIVIIIPTYNEAMNIMALVNRVVKFVPNASVVVVDDNSPDGTASVVRSAMSNYPTLSLIVREKKEGLGKAYLYAFDKVLSDRMVDVVVTMDADFSHDPSYLPAMLSHMDHADLVVGSRYAPGGGISGWVLWRRLLSRFGNMYARMVTGLPVRDLTAGFMAIRGSLLRSIDLSNFDASGYAFLMELKDRLHTAGGHLSECPITFMNRAGGESKLSGHIIREGLIAPWRIRFKAKS